MSSLEHDTERCIILYHPTYNKLRAKDMERGFMDQNFDMNAATHALELAPFGVCIMGEGDQLIYGNKTLFQIFQLDRTAVSRLDQLPSLQAAIKNHDAYVEIDGQPGDAKRTIKCWHHESNASNNTYFFLDVSEQKAVYAQKAALENELARLSTRDELTGLPNKIALLQSLEPLISRSRRYNNPLTVIHLEVDLSKAEDADAAFLSLSHMLRDQMRWADVIGRLGEDKFLLILPETPQDAANILVDKLTVKIDELREATGHGYEVYFGLADWTSGDDSRLLMKRAAESATQRRKASAA